MKSRIDLIGQNGGDGLHYEDYTYGLLDADIVAFKATAIDEKKYDWGDDITSKSYNFDKVKEYIDDVIEAYKLYVDADEMIICLSDDDVNWRKDVYPTYKGQRTGERPVLLYDAKAYMFEKYNSLRISTLEADDVMGIYSTDPTLLTGKKIIISEDKDMKTIPGYLYNPNKHELGVVKITEDEANKFWLYQTLAGDATDNYKGCKGIGDKKATAALKDLTTVDEMWEVVVELYESKDMTLEDALSNARVARICRHRDYDFETKEVVLWKPQEKL